MISLSEKRDFFMQNLPALSLRKILLLSTCDFRGDYQIRRRMRSILIVYAAGDGPLDMQEIIHRYGPPAVCQAASDLISGAHSRISIPGVTVCERLLDVLEVMSAAYAVLPVLEQALYASTLSELEQLALIEEALALKDASTNGGLCARLWARARLFRQRAVLKRGQGHIGRVLFIHYDETAAYSENSFSGNFFTSSRDSYKKSSHIDFK